MSSLLNTKLHMLDLPSCCTKDVGMSLMQLPVDVHIVCTGVMLTEVCHSAFLCCSTVLRLDLCRVLPMPTLHAMHINVNFVRKLWLHYGELQQQLSCSPIYVHPEIGICTAQLSNVLWWPSLSCMLMCQLTSFDTYVQACWPRLPARTVRCGTTSWLCNCSEKPDRTFV